MENYLEVNKASWNNRLESHLNSDFYDLKGFKEGKSSLNQIELEILGNIEGLKILHLQCHFGQDTISLSRMGAEVTGIDLSDKSILKAKELAIECGTKTSFVCSDLYDLPMNLEGDFDMVFTSYGTISWLPDLNKWAGVIDHFLKPGGKFVFVEFHPVVWMFDDDMKKVHYHYFNHQPIIEEEEGTYADRNANLKQKYVCWNHGLAEVMTSLLNKNMTIQSFQEFNYSPYPFVNFSEKIASGKYQIKNFEDKAPLVYALEAMKKKTP